MADFNLAMALVRHHEGGYADVPGDRGGETYAGITRKNHPGWPGWAAVDAAKPLRWNAIVPNAEPHVAPFYEQQYWRKIKGDAITDQRVAAFLFDWYVNSGTWALLHAQRELGLHDDAVIGPKTLAAINMAGTELFDRLKARRIAFVRNLAKAPSQKKFLAGWLRRVNSF